MAAKKSYQACRGTASSTGLRKTVARTCTAEGSSSWGQAGVSMCITSVPAPGATTAVTASRMTSRQGIP
jgi:hypothetical protein